MHPGYIRRHLTKDLFPNRSSSWLPPFSANSNNSGNKLSSVAVGISAARRGSREGRDHDHGSTVGVHSNKPKHTTRVKGRRGCAMAMAGNRNCLAKIWSKSGCCHLVEVRLIPGVIDSEVISASLIFTSRHFFHSVQQSQTVRYFKSARLKDVLKTCWILALLILNWNHLARSRGPRSQNKTMEENWSWGTSWLWGPMLPCWCCVM